MARRLFNLLTALSLLPLIAAAAMWVRSEFTSDVWVHARLVTVIPGRPVAPRVDYVVSHDGGLLFRGSRGGGGFITTTQPSDQGWRHDAGFVSVPEWTLPRVDTWFSRPGVRAGRQQNRSGAGGFGPFDDIEIEFRYWLLVALAAVLPAARVPWLLLERRRRRRRQRRGLCAECGYDLRGGGGRCPECGTSQFSAAGGTPVHAGP
jgi:hypothetical protein